MNHTAQHGAHPTTIHTDQVAKKVVDRVFLRLSVLDRGTGSHSETMAQFLRAVSVSNIVQD